MPLDLESRSCGNVYVIQCAGRITLGEEAKSLEAALAHGAREFSQFVLNVAEVDRLDSIGLGLLVRFMSAFRRRGGDLRLAAPREFVLKLLELTILSNVLQTYSGEQEAILSFLEMPSAQKPQEKRGPRVLVVDQSPDLCVFVKGVLTQHGFDVRSASLVRDARILLQVDEVDYILVGPGIPQTSSETVAQTLRNVSPSAATLQLGPNFKTQDAHEAAAALLEMVSADRGLSTL
ncbi:MAG: hypothetical protein NVSMB62_00710 [Acidobacteriaceae bacterium]